MTAHTVFVISFIFGAIGWLGFFAENLSGRMNRYTRWKDMTNRQWVFAYMMMQFAGAIVVTVLYHAVKDIV